MRSRIDNEDRGKKIIRMKGSHISILSPFLFVAISQREFVIGNGIKMQYLLIADDNEDITDILSTYVKREGYEPLIAADGSEAYQLYNEYKPCIVLLDVMMPQMDGFEVCKKIRSISDVPILLISAKGEDFDKIMGLDIGADDYIVKPFSPSEVMARIRAVSRRINIERSQNEEGNVITLSDLRINLDEYTLYIKEAPVKLTKKEIETMWILAENPNKVFTRDNLLDSLWGYDYYGDSRTVDSHIKRLRAKLDAVSHPNWTIKTIWGMGYKLEVME